MFREGISILLPVLGLVGVSVGMIVYLVGVAVYAPREKVERRLDRTLGGSQSFQADATMPLPDEPFWQRVVAPLFQGLSRQVMRITPVGWSNSLRHKLVLAGNPGGLETGQFLVIYILVICVFTFGAFILTVGADQQILFAGIGLGLGLLLPDMWLKQRIQARQKAILKTLPSFLDLLTVSVEAGLGFDAALSKVTSREQGPLVEEFQRVLQEIRMGKARRDALRDLGGRTEVKELSSFLSALIQADQLGVSVGNVLRVQAQQMRRSRRQRAEEAAMKAPIKMLFPLVLFIFPSLFIVLLGPAVIQMVGTFGQIMR
ncbi:MAG: type II secretion system F family protein [Firmicutes bacterium]|nr:type II secretion system F family protein [Bacillota bacterium]